MPSVVPTPITASSTFAMDLESMLLAGQGPSRDQAPVALHTENEEDTHSLFSSCPPSPVLLHQTYQNMPPEPCFQGLDYNSHSSTSSSEECAFPPFYSPSGSSESEMPNDASAMAPPSFTTLPTVIPIPPVCEETNQLWLQQSQPRPSTISYANQAPAPWPVASRVPKNVLYSATSLASSYNAPNAFQTDMQSQEYSGASSASYDASAASWSSMPPTASSYPPNLYPYRALPNQDFTFQRPFPSTSTSSIPPQLRQPIEYFPNQQVHGAYHAEAPRIMPHDMSSTQAYSQVVPSEVSKGKRKRVANDINEVPHGTGIGAPDPRSLASSSAPLPGNYSRGPAPSQPVAGPSTLRFVPDKKYTVPPESVNPAGVSAGQSPTSVPQGQTSKRSASGEMIMKPWKGIRPWQEPKQTGGSKPAKPTKKKAPTARRQKGTLAEGNTVDDSVAVAGPKPRKRARTNQSTANSRQETPVEQTTIAAPPAFDPPSVAGGIPPMLPYQDQNQFLMPPPNIGFVGPMISKLCRKTV